MLKKLNLRWKILLSLVGLSVIPMTVTLFTVTHLTSQQMAKDMQMRIRDMASFVEQKTTYIQRESGNYIKLLASNANLVNSVYYSNLTSDTAQLQETVGDIHKVFNFDLIEVLKADGSILLRYLPEKEIAPVPGESHPVIEASLEGDSIYDIAIFDGQLSIVAASPLKLEEETIGHLVGVTFLDQHFANQIKAGTGAEIAFFDGSGIVAATNAQLSGVPVDKVLKGDSRQAELNGVPHALMTNSLGGANRGVLMALDISEILAAQENLRRIVLMILIGAAALATLLGLGIASGISRPLREVVDNLKRIAEGGGDLTQTLEVKSQDEVGELALSFNQFQGRLREMVQRTRMVSQDLARATEQIRLSSQEVSGGTLRQSEALEGSFTALQGIDESISGIAESTSTLVDASEEGSSATLELGATIEEIAAQMEKLFTLIDEVSASINETSVSSHQIAENVSTLSSSTEVTASSITELDASIKEIEENAERTSVLSEEAFQDAQRGKEAVEASIAGIGSLQETVDHATVVIRELGTQSSAIGKILTVIDEVADQTSLLALNAAIIAAQAGEHGKAFAVVADEIRELAERTAVSTREIAAIIGNLQKGTQDAVSAMDEGNKRATQEVERSQLAGEALVKIQTSTYKATEQVRSIVRATQEQARGSRQITNSINQVASMLGQIATAIQQQSEGNRQLALAAETMKEIASQVKLSTGEQTTGSRQISQNIEHIRSMAERINSATNDQTSRSRQVVEAFSDIRQIGESNASRTIELDQVVESLSEQTRTLEQEVDAFKA